MARVTALVAVLLTTLLAAAVAAGDPGTDKARLDARIGELRERADQASQAAGVLTTQLGALGDRARAAEAAVAAEEASLASLEASLAAEQARLESLERTIASQSARLAVLQRQYDVALEVLERHLRALYEADDPDIIGFALGATSFSDLLDHYDLLNRIGRQDERIASALARAHTELARARGASERARRDAARSAALIAARTAAQRAARDRVVAGRNELLAAEREKASALASIREDRASYLAEADTLEAESAALAARIVAAQRAAAQARVAAQAPAQAQAPERSARLARRGPGHERVRLAVGPHARGDRHRGRDGHPRARRGRGHRHLRGLAGGLREPDRDRPRQRALHRVCAQLEPDRRAGRVGRQGVRRCALRQYRELERAARALRGARERVGCGSDGVSLELCRRQAEACHLPAAYAASVAAAGNASAGT
jgi:peptidoglycan hydrolase CwlO-like protein